MAFNAGKATTDTSETFEKIEACYNTFDRLLLGEPNDSLYQIQLLSSPN